MLASPWFSVVTLGQNWFPDTNGSAEVIYSGTSWEWDCSVAGCRTMVCAWIRRHTGSWSSVAFCLRVMCENLVKAAARLQDSFPLTSLLQAEVCSAAASLLTLSSRRGYKLISATSLRRHSSASVAAEVIIHRLTFERQKVQSHLDTLRIRPQPSLMTPDWHTHGAIVVGKVGNGRLMIHLRQQCWEVLGHVEEVSLFGGIGAKWGTLTPGINNVHLN